MTTQIEEQKNHVAEVEFVKKSYDDRVGPLDITFTHLETEFSPLQFDISWVLYDSYPRQKLKWRNLLESFPARNSRCAM